MAPVTYTKNSYGDHPGLEAGVIYNTSNSSPVFESARGWWDSFSKGIIGISTFGASICFSVIVTDLPDPVAIRQASPTRFSGHIHFDRETVRKFLAIAWLNFLLALGFSLISQLKLRTSNGLGGTLRLLGLILNCLILAAFMMLSLAVSAYVPEVGIAGVAFLSFFAMMVIGMWITGET
jgi:hypothetical protein